MRGRPEALWGERIGLEIDPLHAEVPSGSRRRLEMGRFSQVIETVASAGFSGIYIDRNGFWDRGASMVSQLQSLLGEAPIESKDRRLAFFNLSAFAQALRAQYTPEQWEAERREALELPSSDTAQ